MKARELQKYENYKNGPGLIWFCGVYAPEIVTNADLIQAMSDEELDLLQVKRYAQSAFLTKDPI